jgi:hypothetical protein
MRAKQIVRRKARARDDDGVLPIDPRDPDIVRAKRASYAAAGSHRHRRDASVSER